MIYKHYFILHPRLHAIEKQALYGLLLTVKHHMVKE